jgi:peptide deformylase
VTAGVPRAVVRAPSAVLGVAGQPVDPCDPAIVALVGDLFATMAVSPGCVGLAAPQVGVSAQVFVVDVRAHPKTRTCHGAFALCNARVTEASRWERAREGCLSVPDLTGDVRRAGRLTVVGLAPGTGSEVTMRTDGFEARALQHEIDHCAGLLFLDRAAGAHAIFPRRTYL